MAKSTIDAIVVRPAVERDAAGIVKYLRENQDRYRYMISKTNEMNLTREYEEKTIRLHAQRENCLFLVALSGREVVGVLNFVGGSRMRDRHDGEFGVSVHKDLFSKGIGRRLVSYLLNWARENPVLKRVTLFVMNDNRRALEMYKQLGFQIEGVRRKAVRFEDGRVQDLIMMGKLKKEGSNEWTEDTGL